MKYNEKKWTRGALALCLCLIVLLSGCAQQTPQVVVPGQGSMPMQQADPTPEPLGDFAPAQPAMPDSAPAQPDPNAVPADPNAAGDAAGEDAQAGWTDPNIVDMAGVDTLAEQAPVMVAGDINIGMVLEDEAALHPLDCIYRDLISMNELVFESVITLDDSMRPVGELADTWTNAGANYTFHLRSGILFHNGEPLTAQDVVESYQYIRARGDSCPWYDRTSGIRDMVALDETSLSVTFANEGFASLYAMTFPVVQRYTLDNALPMGTGPYWYTNYYVNSYLRLEANPFWWKKAARTQSVVGRRYPDTQSALTALLTGEIDTLATRSAQASLYKKLTDYTTADYTTLSYELIVPNMTSGAMTDIRMREALMYGIDRTAIASTVYGNMVQESEVPVVPGSYLYETQAAQYNYSPERALQLLHEIGWSDSNGDGMLDIEVDGLLENFTIKLVTYNDNVSSSRSDAAYLIAEQLSKIGVTVEIETVSKGKMEGIFKKGEFDIALVAVNLSYVPDLTALLRHDGKLNFSGYADKDMNNLLLSARAASTADDLASIYSEIQLMIVEKLPILGMYYHTGAVISTADVSVLHGIYELNTWNGMELVEP